MADQKAALTADWTGTMSVALLAGSMAGDSDARSVANSAAGSDELSAESLAALRADCLADLSANPKDALSVVQRV